MKDWTGNANSIYKTLGASNHTEDERQSEDFYSTQKQTVLSLLNKLKEYNINLSNSIMIEPAVGSGNILKACFETNEGYNKYLAYDIVDRGFPNTKVVDFLTVSKEEIPEETKTIITNPPYGERLEDKESLPGIYETFGKRFAELDSWSAYMITSYEDAEKYFGRKADKNRKIYNGMIKTYFYSFLGPKPPKRKE